MKSLGSGDRIHRLVLFSAASIAIALVIRFYHNRKTAAPTIADLQQAVRSHPDNAQAQLDLGEALFAQHRMSEAEEACQAAAELAPADTRPLNALARIAIAEHHSREALGYLAASLKIRQDNSTVWRTYGIMLQKDNAAAAWEALRRATDIDDSKAASLLRAGMLEVKQKKISHGLKDIQHAAELNPNDLMTDVELGDALRANNQPGPALQAYAKALDISPDNALALGGSAAATIQLDQSPAALIRAGQQLDKSIQSAPLAETYRVRGQLKLIERHYGAAVTDLKTALRMDPTLSTAHSMLYQCYAAMGNKSLAHREAAVYSSMALSSIETDPIKSGTSP